MFRGNSDAGVTHMLRASTGHPHLPRVSSSLGAAYYQVGRLDVTEKSFADARRIDPNDPVPDLIGSVMAMDRYAPGDAIRLARQGFEKALKGHSFAVENLSNSKNGSASLGSAYTTLGLHEWGGFYTQLAFEPYLANGYFYLSEASQHRSADARLSVNTQGLLLEPTAVSEPTRYYEPFRTPRTDVSAAFGLRANGGAATGQGSLSLQGFARAPHPLAWFANATFSRDDGHRNNSDLTVSSLFAGAGTSFGDRRHHLLVTVDAAKARSGVPGSTVTSDPDDRSDNEFMFAGIGYQHRFNFDNRLIVRLVAGSERVRARAPQNLTDPLGRAFTCCVTRLRTKTTV
ncbi:MAG: hypothetical protein HOI95_27215 [Chromatiales bacterium]|jgi:hypothetical protein|nr:hypothetical protein [Chromatiales bacterium]